MSTNALAGRATSTFDPAGLLLTTADQLSTLTSTIYDPFKRGLVAQMINGAGASVRATTLESYDDAGRTTRSRDANGWWSQSAFDGAGRLTLSTDARGGTTGSVYDLLGRLVKSRDAMGRWSENVYDDRDRVVVQINALGERVTMAYDRAGNLTTVTDALGRVYTSIYDALNRQTGSIDALGRRTTTTHDAVGNVSTITDFLNRTTSYTYDLLNRQTKVTEAVGTSVARTTETGFTAVGTVLTSKDALGNVYTYTYDDLDRLIETLDPLGNRATNTYDAASNLITMKDALGKVYTSVYDPLHRLIGSIDPAGNRTTSVLDAAGQQAASIDGVGNVSVNLLDELGRGVGSVDARGAVVLNQVDASGSLRMLTDPVGNEWRWSVDGLGRESVRFDPAGKAVTTTYDIAGRVSTVTDRLGQQMLYTYDTGDRTTQVVWKNAGGTAVNTIVYSYDDNDNLLTAADSSGTVTYTFDELNRTRTYTNIFGQSLTYTYDFNSNVTLREDSLGGVLTSVYDTGGRLTSRRYGGSGETPVRVDFGYTNRDELGTITRYSDVAGTTLVGTTSMTFDDAGRLTGILNKNASAATLSYYNYTLDNADRVSTHTWWSQIGTVVYSGTKTYTYDTTDQLTNDSSTTFTYDDAGNRTMSGYTTGVANRITNDGVYTYTYDDAGNMTQQSKGSGLETWFYGYDVGNRLTSIRKTSDGSTNLLLITYTYDPEGKRVKEEKWESGVGSTTTRMAFDGVQVWADLDNSNAVQVRYLWGDERTQLLARTNTGVGVRWVMQDRLSSIRDVADSSGALAGHIDYGSFGAITTESHPTESGRFGFTAFAKIDGAGMLWASETRFLNTGFGGWTQDDFWLFGGGDTNVRRYVGNNVTNAIDPTGQLYELPGPRYQPFGPPPGAIAGGAGEWSDVECKRVLQKQIKAWDDKGWILPSKFMKRYLEKTGTKYVVTKQAEVDEVKEEADAMVKKVLRGFAQDHLRALRKAAGNRKTVVKINKSAGVRWTENNFIGWLQRKGTSQLYQDINPLMFYAFGGANMSIKGNLTNIRKDKPNDVARFLCDADIVVAISDEYEFKETNRGIRLLWDSYKAAHLLMVKHRFVKFDTEVTFRVKLKNVKIADSQALHFQGFKGIP